MKRRRTAQRMRLEVGYRAWIRDWSKKFGVTPDELKVPLKKVGPMADELKKKFRK